MRLAGSAEVIYWRGPSPFYFALLPADVSDAIKSVAAAVSYGWGAIQADVTVQGFTWRTAIFPKDGTYVVPLKKAVREQITVTVGDVVEVALVIGV